jgi:hypothetical protein
MAFDDEFDHPLGRPKYDPERLRRLARYQRWLIAVVLAQLVLWFGFVVVLIFGRNLGAGAIKMPIVLTFVLNVVGAVYVFLASWDLRGAFAAACSGLATLFPFIGLLVITMVNSEATRELKKNGVKVGIFGASAADIVGRPSPYDDEDAGW